MVPILLGKDQKAEMNLAISHKQTNEGFEESLMKFFLQLRFIKFETSSGFTISGWSFSFLFAFLIPGQGVYELSSPGGLLKGLRAGRWLFSFPSLSGGRDLAGHC